jgi:hypothetical protein
MPILVQLCPRPSISWRYWLTEPSAPTLRTGSRTTERKDGLRLESASALQELLELVARLEGLNVRVATNVLALDEDVGDGALAGDVLEGVLEVTAVGWAVLAD